MKQPLIVKGGQLQASEDERVSIWKLNIGPSDTVIVAGLTINITSTLHHLVSLVGAQDVKTILGGEEGDLLVLTGENVKLVKGGNINITNKLPLSVGEAIAFIYIAGVWTRLKG